MRCQLRHCLTSLPPCLTPVRRSPRLRFVAACVMARRCHRWMSPCLPPLLTERCIAQGLLRTAGGTRSDTGPACSRGRCKTNPFWHRRRVPRERGGLPALGLESATPIAFLHTPDVLHLLERREVLRQQRQLVILWVTSEGDDPPSQERRNSPSLAPWRGASLSAGPSGSLKPPPPCSHFPFLARRSSIPASVSAAASTVFSHTANPCPKPARSRRTPRRAADGSA